MEADEMARVTLEKRIELENEEMALAFFRRALSKLPDPRRRQGIRYPFSALVTIALMAMVCGCDDAEAMESWGEANETWLHSISPCSNVTQTESSESPTRASALAGIAPTSYASLPQSVVRTRLPWRSTCACIYE